jgi:tetratricopeptide (TPR) repeat protein
MKRSINLKWLGPFMLLFKLAFSQDSKNQEVVYSKAAGIDTNNINALLKSAAQQMNNNPTNAFDIAEQALKNSQSIQWKKGEATAYSRMGNAKEILSQYNEALALQQKSLAIRSQLKDSIGIANCYRNLGSIYSAKRNFKKAKQQHLKALQIFNVLNYTKGIAASYKNLGIIEECTGNYGLAKNYYAKALSIEQSMHNLKGVATTLANMGNLDQLTSDYIQAIEKYLAALKIFDEIGEKQLLAYSYGNISIIYLRMKEFEKANLYNQKCLDLSVNLENIASQANCYSLKGSILADQNFYKEAIDAYTKGVALYNSIDDTLSNATLYCSMVDCYLGLNKIKEAKNFLNRAMNIDMALQNKDGMASNHYLLSKILLLENKVNEAHKIGQIALKEAQGLKEKKLQADITKLLAECNEKLDSNTLAIDYYKQHIQLKDSLISNKKIRQLAYAEADYSLHKKIEKSEHKAILADKELAQKEKHLSKAKDKNNKMAVSIILCFFIIVWVGKSYSRTKKDKNKLVKEIADETENKNSLILENHVVTEKNREVTKSIEDAKRLQQAILPPDKIVKQYLDQSFILYLPKDIVAGDFYWMHTDGDWVWFAACDCTGHGVPGAMLTLVCHEALNKAVKEMKAQNPAQALDYASLLIEEHFNKEGNPISIADGMDASLCLLHTKTNELFWAGANNPLWVFRKHILLEYKADKQPVGKYEYRKNFTLHKINLEMNDAIYIFSDGFADQFGGLVGKKMMKKRFEATLLSLQAHHMEDQKQELITYFQNWKQEAEQVDDVLVMGYRL